MDHTGVCGSLRKGLILYGACRPQLKGIHTGAAEDRCAALETELRLARRTLAEREAECNDAIAKVAQVQRESALSKLEAQRTGLGLALRSHTLLQNESPCFGRSSDTRVRVLCAVPSSRQECKRAGSG